MNSSPFYAFREQSYAALRKTSLEWTRVANGYFMDYWGIPRGLKSQMTPSGDFAIDIAHKKAAIPGDGNQVMCFTYTYDVGKYLSAWLELTDKWEETTYIYGERTTWNGFLKEAEAITGKSYYKRMVLDLRPFGLKSYSSPLFRMLVSIYTKY